MDSNILMYVVWQWSIAPLQLLYGFDSLSVFLPKTWFSMLNEV